MKRCPVYCAAMLFSIMLLPVVCLAQISGMVTDEKGQPIAQANVLLLATIDSSVVKGTISSAAGSFALEKIVAGTYLLRVSYTGFEDMYSQPFAFAAGENKDMGKLPLKVLPVELGQVTVTARKPLFEQKIDRMVVNVRNSITAAGSTVLEILERSPGVLVDRVNNGVSINGKSGVRILINGKVTNMPLEAVVQMLSTMSSSNIERIELITTPPAHLDAEGNAGFINIVFINNPNQGFSGSWTATAGIGQGDLLSGAVNFNYRHKKVNLYGDYSITRLGQVQEFGNFRRITKDGVTTEINSISDRDAIQRNHNVRLGLDYQVNKKTVLGLLVGGYDNRWSMSAVNNVTNYKDGVKDTVVLIPNREINHWKNFNSNLNLQHNFTDSESISIDLNYIRYNDNNPTDYHSHYFDGSGNPLFIEETRSTKLTPIRMWIGSTDYKKKLGKKVEMEAGLKQALLRFNNKVGVATLDPGGWKPDPDLTSDYKLKENISAAYTAFAITWSEKLNLKLGLRYEYTTTLLTDASNQKFVDRKYGKFFPSVFISRKLNDDNSLNLSYSRRITRPAFDDLAPFVIFLDPNTFFSGNVNLRPSIIDAVKMDFVHKSYVFSLGYSYEDRTIAGFQGTVDVNSNKQYMQAQNLNYTKMLTAVISVPVKVNGWWNMNNNITATGQELKADYDKHPTVLRKVDVSLNSTQTLTLPKNYTIELSGFMQTPTVFGIYRIGLFGFLNVGLQKKFKDNSSLRANLDDVFSSKQFQMTADRPQQFYYTRTKIDISRRIVKLTYTRNFGKKELKEKRDRRTGSEEESGRVK